MRSRHSFPPSMTSGPVAALVVVALLLTAGPACGQTPPTTVATDATARSVPVRDTSVAAGTDRDLLLDPAVMVPSGGFAWSVILPPAWSDVADHEEAPRRSSLRLLEDGVDLGAGHGLHATIREQGGGAFSHWKTSLLFSTSDGTDPRANGRRYRIYDWREALPLFRAGEAHPCGQRLPCHIDPSAAPGYLPDRPLLDVVDPVVAAGAVAFPVPGVYTLAGGASGPDAGAAPGDGAVSGGLTTALAYGDSVEVNVAVVFAFMTGASDGGQADDAAFNADPPGFVQGLFRRRAPAALACGTTARAMALLLDQLGVRSRLVQWLGLDAAHVAHQSLEVELPGHGWTLYDPHLGVAFHPGFDALDVFGAVERGESLSPRVALYVGKASWEPQPWDAYHAYARAMGQFDGSVLQVVVNAGAACCPTDAIGGRAYGIVSTDELAGQFYSP